MKISFLIISLMTSTIVFGHSGGTDSSGCHNDHVRGGYHCHKSDTSVPKTLVRSPSSVKEAKKVKHKK